MTRFNNNSLLPTTSLFVLLLLLFPLAIFGQLNTLLRDSYEYDGVGLTADALNEDQHHFNQYGRQQLGARAKFDPASADDVQPSPQQQASNWREKCNQRCEERMMEITGVGIQTIKSEQAEVRATIEFKRMIMNATGHVDIDVSDEQQLSGLISSVQSGVSRKSAEVVRFLKEDPNISKYVTKLRTSSITLEPIQEYINNRMIVTGYRASNSIIFRVELPMAGAVVDQIVERGVTRIDGISFVATPKEVNLSRQMAITQAVEDAIQQALSALSGLGHYAKGRTDLQIVKLDVIGLTRPESDESSADMNMSGGNFAAQPVMARAFKAESTPIEGQQRTITATVAVKIRF